MKPRILLAALTVALAALAHAQPQSRTAPIDDAAFGLAKGSVFDVATPKLRAFPEDRLAKPIAPPVDTPIMIPHEIDDNLPITAGRNDCLECHDRPADIGRKPKRDDGRAMPATHYAKGDVKAPVDGARYNCTSCHAPQADVPALVRNTATRAR